LNIALSESYEMSTAATAVGLGKSVGMRHSRCIH